MLLGRGDLWTFDDDLYSGKGLGPGSTIGGRRFGKVTPDSSLDVVDVNLISESRFGERSLAVEPAATNLLSASQRNASSASVFGVVTGGSIAADGSHYLDTGEATPLSIKHTRTALNQGVETNANTISASTAYAGSVYVLTDQSGVRVDVNLVDDVAQFATVNASLAQNKWVRIPVAGTSNVGATAGRVQVVVTNGAAAGDIWCEAWQLEQASVATTWADPSRAAGDLGYSSGFLVGAAGYTFAFWARLPTANPSATGYLYDLTQSGVSGATNRLYAYRTSGTNDLVVRVLGNNGQQSTITHSGTPWDNTWRHVVVTVSKGAMSLYLDGSLYQTVTGIDFPIFAVAEVMNFASIGGSARLDGLLDEILVLPYAVSADFVTALYGRTTQLPALPKLHASGDAIEAGGTVLVEGLITDRPYNPLMLSGTWESTAQRVRFDLET